MPDFNLGNLANAFRPVSKSNPAQSSANPANQTPNQQPNNQQNQPQRDPVSGMPVNQNNPGADPNNQDLNITDPNNQQKKPSSPLDAFKDLFTIDPKKEPAKDPLEEAVFNLDPKKLGTAVSGLDFTKGLNPESITKALQGDTVEFGNILNHVTRSAYMMSTQMLIQMMEGGIKTNNGRFEKSLSGKFRDLSIQSTGPKNPALNHPAAKPVVAALKQQISSQNPDLSPSEVQEQAENYFLAMGKALTSVGDENNPDPNKPGGGSKEQDWTQYINQ